MKLKSMVVICSLFVGTFLTKEASALNYTVTNLSLSYANDINNSGQVVGSLQTPNGIWPFLNNNGTRSMLDSSTGTATSINNSGRSVGTISTWVNNGVYRGDYDRATILPGMNLGTLGGNYSYASAINDVGQVAGYSTTTPGEVHATLWSGGATNDLGTLGGTTSIANDINNSGRVVGFSSLAGDSISHAFFYNNVTMQDIGTLGGSFSNANAISDTNQVVGYSSISGDTTQHAFIFINGIMKDLGTLGGNYSLAKDINNSGQVVGSSTTVGNLADHATLWNNGSILDLNDLLVNNDGWTLTNATAINDLGQIVGNGIHINYDGIAYNSTFLLTPIEEISAPVPEPSTMLLLGAGLAGFVFYRRKKMQS